MELSCLLLFFLYLQSLQAITSSGKAGVDSGHDEVCNKWSNHYSEGPPWQVPIELIIDWTLLTGEKKVSHVVNSNLFLGEFHGFVFFPSAGPGFGGKTQYCFVNPAILQYQRTANGKWSPPEDSYHRALWYRCVQRSESRSTPNKRQEKASPDDDTEWIRINKM